MYVCFDTHTNVSVSVNPNKNEEARDTQVDRAYLVPQPVFLVHFVACMIHYISCLWAQLKGEGGS
jgi:hypothetical protein